MPSSAAIQPAAPATERFVRAVVRRNQAPVVALMASMAPVKVGCGGVHPGDLIAGDVGGVVVAPQARAASMLKPAQEIGAREFEQARPIIAEKSLRKGQATYGLS